MYFKEYWKTHKYLSIIGIFLSIFYIIYLIFMDEQPAYYDFLNTASQLADVFLPTIISTIIFHFVLVFIPREKDNQNVRPILEAHFKEIILNYLYISLLLKFHLKFKKGKAPNDSHNLTTLNTIDLIVLTNEEIDELFSSGYNFGKGDITIDFFNPIYGKKDVLYCDNIMQFLVDRKNSMSKLLDDLLKLSEYIQSEIIIELYESIYSKFNIQIAMYINYKTMEKDLQNNNTTDEDVGKVYFKCKDRTGHTFTSSISHAKRFDKRSEAIEYNYKWLYGDCEVMTY